MRSRASADSQSMHPTDSADPAGHSMDRADADDALCSMRAPIASVASSITADPRPQPAMDPEQVEARRAVLLEQARALHAKESRANAVQLHSVEPGLQNDDAPPAPPAPQLHAVA